MLLRFFFGHQNILKLLVCFTEHLLKVKLVLRLESDRIAHLNLALADDAACNGHSLLHWIVRDTELALGCVTSTVELTTAVRVLMALLAEVCVGSAPE